MIIYVTDGDLSLVWIMEILSDLNLEGYLSNWMAIYQSNPQEFLPQNRIHSSKQMDTLKDIK